MRFLMNLLEQAQHFLESKGFLVESETDLPGDWPNEKSANVFYYIGRLITNKGPQTEASIEKYLNTKFDNNIPLIGMPGESRKTWNVGWRWILKEYFVKDGRKWDFKETLSRDNWNEVAKWHDSNAIETDPNAKYAKLFWDWYNEKKKGKNFGPDEELITFFKKSSEETAKKVFGKYYNLVKLEIGDYIGPVSNEDRTIKAFWNWHRAKKNGEPYPMPQEVIKDMVKFLKTPRALEVMQQYYYYAVRVIEKLADTVIKTPVNLTGLQKELQRIMDNLDNDKYVDELEKIELNRLHGGDMTAGPVFVLPTEVVKSIRTLAKDTKNVDKEKVGKVDKTQVKECYVYCTNELNRKFHIGRTGIFDLNIQDFYDTYKIVFTRGFNTKTLYKIFDEVCQYLLDQLDKGTAEYWKNRGKIEVGDVDDFNEAFKTLKSAGYVILEDVTDEVLQHGLSPFDKAKLEKGQKPSWAKSVTELGSRPKRPKGSSDWTEKAWRSVRGEKEPYSESDWRRDNELNLKDNQDLEERLKAILNINAEFEATKDKLNVYVTGKRFEVECRGLKYIVKMFGHDSVFNRSYATVNSLSNVAKFIEENV